MTREKKRKPARRGERRHLKSCGDKLRRRTLLPSKVEFCSEEGPRRRRTTLRGKRTTMRRSFRWGKYVDGFCSGFHRVSLYHSSPHQNRGRQISDFESPHASDTPIWVFLAIPPPTGWLVGRSVGRSVGRTDGRTDGRVLGLFVRMSVCLSDGWFFSANTLSISFPASPSDLLRWILEPLMKQHQGTNQRCASACRLSMSFSKRRIRLNACSPVPTSVCLVLAHRDSPSSWERRRSLTMTDLFETEGANPTGLCRD